MSKVYCFASGKGGVGKSTLSANLAVLLAQRGRSVVLIDCDIGLRALDLFLGVESQIVYDLMDVVRGSCLLSEALLPVPSLPLLRLLPAGQFSRARDLDPKKLKKILNLLRDENDFIFLDCPAGLERGLRNVLNANIDEAILVTTPDDLCLRDAEQVVSLLDRKDLPRPRLIVNRLQPDLIRAGEMMSAQVIASSLDLPLLGEIPDDPAVYRAQLRRHPFVSYQSDARDALTRIASRLDGKDEPFPDYGKKKFSIFRRSPRSLREVKS